MTLTDDQLSDLLETASRAAHQAGAVARQAVGQTHHIREKKGPRDVVTDVDHAAQRAALAVIRKRHPDHTILAEEDPAWHPDDDGIWSIPKSYVWAVDPIDGTTNFTHTLPMFSVSVGVAFDGVPVAGVIYDPLRDELFSAAHGQGAALNQDALPPLPATGLRDAVFAVDWAHDPAMRTHIIELVASVAPHCRTLRALGSAALGLAYVAAGRVQGYANFGLQPWDTCAGAVMLRETGADLRGLDGRPWAFGDSRVLAGHPSLLDAIQKVLEKAS